MSNKAIIQRLGNLGSYKLGVDIYDQDKLGCPIGFIQRAGVSNENNWAGPLEVDDGYRFGETRGITGTIPRAVVWSDTATSKITWLFVAEGTAAGSARWIMLFEIDRITGIITYRGFITPVLQSGNHTARGLDISLERYTTGTVEVSGLNVTGTGSSWQTDRLATGSRIGFGSTEPSSIATWYELSTITSDTAITLTSSAGTIPAGTPYVIEDFRLVLLTQNSLTATNGGVFLCKGLRPEIFTVGGTPIIQAVSDNTRATYWLKDAATITNTGGNGCSLQARDSWQQQWLWSGNGGTTTIQLFKHNIRAALTIASGASTNQFSLSTAVSSVLTGTLTQSNNSEIVTTNSGPGMGQECLYFLTSTRVYRTKPLDLITAGETSATYLPDLHTPSLPGGASNWHSGAAMTLGNRLEYIPSLDSFLLVSPTAGIGSTGLLRYMGDSTSLLRWGYSNEHGRYRGTNAAKAAHGVIEPTGNQFWARCGNGIVANCYLDATAGMIHLVNFANDWEYATSTTGRLILPRMPTPDANKFMSVFVQEAQSIGTQTGISTAIPTNPHRVQYRTTGISDNSGSWQDVDSTGILDIAGTSEIQFSILFRTIGYIAQTSRIYSLALVYDDNGTLDNYRFSVNKSDAANKRFAWFFAQAFGGAVPNLKIRLYDITDPESPSLLVTDTTSSPTGTWERSTDGTSWSTWNNTDKANDTTYLRYTPASISDNVIVEAKLSLA